jgi:diguanylate cyclase (GGDEF)-like protein
MKQERQLPYIEPTIRTIAGSFLLICGLGAVYYPAYLPYWLGFLFFISINLFQSGITRFCLMEKILKRAGFRSEMDEIRSMAQRDLLTELPNRSYLEEHIDAAIAEANRNNRKVAMLFIDLDNFKQINDIQGHRTGDALLVLIAKSLKARLRPYDTLARWGGDEFVILIHDITDARQTRAIGEKIMRGVAEDLEEYQHLHTTLSIGVAVYPDDANSTEALQIQADKALFHAKAQGRNNIQIFGEMHSQGSGFHDAELTSAFSRALIDKKLDVHYQPVVDATNHTPVSVEALARWYDEKNGWISPGIFIPLAENMGLIEEVGSQVMAKSLAHYSTCPWKDRIRLAVNVSNRQLFSSSFLPTLIDLLLSNDLAPENLKLEITESSALETDNAINTLQTLSDAGFYMSLDDFGTGFSSLSRLHQLPFNELKIDMSFVRRIKTEEGRTMLKTITNMGKSMNLAIVAEGIEDKESADILRDMGVDYLQGFYFSKPKPHDECLLFTEGGYTEAIPTEPCATSTG